MPLKAAFAPVVPDAADGEPPVNPKTLPVPGFVIKTFAMADSQKWFLNCCSHSIVDRPLANGTMEPVDDAYLDAWCLANVQVPLHTCSKRTTVDHAGEASIAVDVLFNPALIARATATGSKNASAFQEYMCSLAIKHVEKDMGVRLDKKGKVIRAAYKGGRGDGSLPVPVPELIAMEQEQIARAMKGRQPRAHAEAGNGKKLVQEFNSWDEVERAAAARKAGAHELPAGNGQASRTAAEGSAAPGGSDGKGRSSGTVMKPGFLNSGAGKLYPTGSTEGTPAKNAGDPLGWMPEKLRSRVCTVDTAAMSEEEQHRLMRVHAGLEEDPKARAAAHAFDDCVLHASQASAVRPPASKPCVLSSAPPHALPPVPCCGCAARRRRRRLGRRARRRRRSARRGSRCATRCPRRRRWSASAPIPTQSSSSASCAW